MVDIKQKRVTILSKQIEALFKERQLIIVSNREPYEHTHSDKRITVRKPAGGLISALDPVMQTVGGTWIAWGSGDADRDTVDEHDRVAVPPQKPAYSLRRVWMSADEIAGFYEGHVNQTLWPLFHSQMEKVRFSRKEWDTYQQINRRFAECVVDEVTNRNDIVWFQDYHFATAPAMTRDRLPDALIAQFWHIPWPPWEVFRIHPQRRALLEGLLSCDFIGMHLALFCENFLECVHREFGYSVDMEQLQVVAGNRTVHLAAVPISVDANWFATIASSKRAEHAMQLFRDQHQLKDMKIGIGVERTDYTKGILERLGALEEFFELNPEWQKRFTFVQVCSPSRNTIPVYKHFWQQVHSEINRINRRFQKENWKPILLIEKAQSHAQLAALYRLADIAIVSSLQDGMNLVAKEFIASQVDEQGVLILSEFAGASEEMPQAHIINPYDIEGFVLAIEQALNTETAERKRVMRQLRHHLFQHTIFDWMANIFSHLQNLVEPQKTHFELRPALQCLQDIERRFVLRPYIELFCDYDGVLAPISPRPQDAVIDDHMRELLVRLRDTELVHLNIISGRDIGDISQCVGVERLTYAGNHGLQIQGPRIERYHEVADELMERMQQLYDELRLALRAVPGVIIENKQLSLSVHYRLCDPKEINAAIDVCYKLFEKYNADGLIHLTSVKKAMEFRSTMNWDKGRATNWILRELHGLAWSKAVLPIYLGDDETDEDAFRTLKKTGIGIRVGRDDVETTACYKMNGTEDVGVFLDWIQRLCTRHSQ